MSCILGLKKYYRFLPKLPNSCESSQSPFVRFQDNLVRRAVGIREIEKSGNRKVVNWVLTTPQARTLNG